MNLDEFSERFLEKGRERYEAGHKYELLYCLNYCVGNGLPIPDWLKQAFERACTDVHMYRVKSWDDVFGKPLKKGHRLETERRNMEIAFPLYQCIRKLHEAGELMDKPLFDAVGKEFGVSGTIASDLYYKLMREFVESDDDIVDRK